MILYLAHGSIAVETSPGLSNFKNVNKYVIGMFSDVKNQAWYSDSVAQVYELGLMLGNSKKTFNPTGTITVSETVVLACRLYSIYHNDEFSFKSGEPWYRHYVEYALTHGIVENAGMDYLKPVTRAEFATIMAKALPAVEFDAINTVEEGAIPDVTGSAPYSEAVYALYRAGILAGNDINGTFAPDSNIERCSVAAIVTRMVEKAARRSFSLYAPFDLTYEYYAEPTHVNNIIISKLTAKRQQNNCTFMIQYSAKYAASDFSFFNAPSGNAFVQNGKIHRNQNSFCVTIPLEKLKQVYESESPYITIKFTNSNNEERYLLSVLSLDRLWNAATDEMQDGDIELLNERQYGGTNIGINFWFDNETEAYFDDVLPKIAATNAHLKIGVQHLVDTKSGYSVTPMDDKDFSVIRMCIEKAQDYGIKVDMLMIYMEDKIAWQNPIEPAGDNVASFFSNHKVAALKVAALCDTYKIPILGLVNECDALTNSDYAQYWADETKTIKAAYPQLRLTCASTTWNGETRKLLEYKKAGIDNICNYLDFLGVNLYPVLTTLPVSQVTDDQLVNGWFGMDYPTASTGDCSMYELLENTYEAYKKPLLITEIGCAPKELGLADPLNYNADTKKSANNKHVQYLYLKTAYDVLGQTDFVAGIYIWDAYDTWTPYYWLDNTELVPYITDYYRRVFR